MITISNQRMIAGSMKMMMLKSFAQTFLWITAVLVYTRHPVFSEFVVRPQNTLAEHGKETSLECCSSQNNSVLEWHIRKGNEGELFTKLCSQQTCQGEGYSANNFSRDCSRLNINASLVEVAGLYMCSELGNGDRCAAYLVIYQFNCSHNIIKNKLDGGLKVVVACTVLWNGKLPFEMVLLTASGKEMQPTQFSQRQDLYSASFSVYLPGPILPPYTIRIQLLSTENADECIDTHSPIANRSLPGEQLMYAVTNVRTNCPKKDCEKKKGDVINCSADGFPIPTFQWLDWDLKPVGDGSVLQVNDVGSVEFTCVSRNTINGLEYEAWEKIIVTVPVEREVISMSMIILICLTLLIVISIHFIIRVVEPKNIRNYVHDCLKKKNEILLPMSIEDNNPPGGNRKSEEAEVLLPLSRVAGVIAETLSTEDGATSFFAP